MEGFDFENLQIDSTKIDISQIIKSEYAHYIIFGCSIFSMLWAGFNVLQVSNHTPLPLRLTSAKMWL
jgi:uncharacterized protein (DUF2249 family)